MPSALVALFLFCAGMSSALSPVEASAGSIASSRREISSRWPGWLLDQWAERMQESLEVPMDTQRVRTARSLERIALRTRFFDCFLSSALEHPAVRQQALLLAVGGDMRSFRLEATGRAKMFEVDLPEVARRRMETLDTLEGLPERDVVCVGADVTEETFLEKLAEAGFDTTAAAGAVTLAEGLFYYLDESHVRAALERLSRIGGVVCFSAVGERRAKAAEAANPQTAKRPLSSLFKWRCADPAQFAKDAGWKHARAFKLGATDGGCDSFDEYLEMSGDGEKLEVRRLEGETFYVVAATEDDRFWPFSDPTLPPPGFKDSRRAAVVVCGKALRAGRAPAELVSRVRRANQLFHALASQGRPPELVLSGGRGEATAMEEILRSLGNETVTGVREEESGNTRENARLAMDQIGPNVEVLFVVTSSYHLPRAVRAFEREAARRQRKNLEVRGYGDFWTIAQSTQRHEDEHVDMRRDGR